MKKGIIRILPLSLFTGSCLLVVAVLAAVPQGKQYELKYNLAAGTKFIIQSTGTSTIISEQMGTEITTEVTGTGEDKYLVLSEEAGKGVRLEMEYGERSQDMQSDMGSDSTDFSGLIGQKVRFSLAPTGKVDGYEGFEKLPEITTSGGDTMNQKTYELGAKTTFSALPEKPVRIGDTWDETEVMDVPVGAYSVHVESDITYKLVGEEKRNDEDCAVIEVKGTVKTTGDFEQNGTPLSLERETTMTGKMYFAYKKGMFVYGETESKASGTVSVPSMGMEIPQSITSKGTVAVLFDK